MTEPADIATESIGGRMLDLHLRFKKCNNATEARALAQSAGVAALRADMLATGSQAENIADWIDVEIVGAAQRASQKRIA